MSFKILHSDTREEWFENRRAVDPTTGHHVLSGTDIARLMTGGPKVWSTIREEKRGNQKPFTNKYVEWGKAREPVIGDYARMFIDSRLEANDQFLVSTRWPGIGCTPDLLGTIEEDSDGKFVEIVGEIKTSKYPMPDFHDSTYFNYRVQCEVEMMVSDADALAFVWERHDGDWVNGPTPYRITNQVLHPDHDLREKILETVERFNTEDDPAADVDMKRLLHRLRELDLQMTELKMEDSRLRSELQSMLTVGDKFVNDWVSVSYYQPSQRSSFDKKGFGEKYPELLKEFTTVTAAKPVMRVRFPKEG